MRRGVWICTALVCAAVSAPWVGAAPSACDGLLDADLDALQIRPIDPNLPEKLLVNPRLTARLPAGSSIERIEREGINSFVVVREPGGAVSRYPVAIAPMMEDPANYDLKFVGNAEAFKERYPKWNDIFRVAHSPAEGPLYREMYLSPDALKAIGRDGLLVRNSPGFTTLYFAGYHEVPTDPVSGMQYAFSQSGNYLPVIFEISPARAGIQAEAGGYLYTGSAYFHETVSQDIPLDKIEHVWVFNKNAPASESPYIDVKGQLMHLRDSSR